MNPFDTIKLAILLIILSCQQSSP